MDPVRRSQICFRQLHDRTLALLMITYPNTSIETAGNQVHIIELQRRHWTSVTHKAPVDLAAPEIPQTNHAVRSTARQCGIETLQGANKVRRRIRHTTRLPPAIGWIHR